MFITINVDLYYQLTYTNYHQFTLMPINMRFCPVLQMANRSYVRSTRIPVTSYSHNLTTWTGYGVLAVLLAVAQGRAMITLGMTRPVRAERERTREREKERDKAG